MEQRGIVMQLLGCLMKNPLLLGDINSYNLTPNDFEKTLDKQIFARYEHVKSFYRDYLGKWIIFGIKDNEIIDKFVLKDFHDYSIITRAKY